MISRFWNLFFSTKNIENRIWEGLLRPMTVISTQGVSSMYGESACERILKNKIFFPSKTFLKFAGTSQKWVKNRLPKSLKKSKYTVYEVV